LSVTTGILPHEHEAPNPSLQLTAFGGS
jgi:hypothetical protein